MQPVPQRHPAQAALAAVFIGAVRDAANDSRATRDWVVTTTWPSGRFNIRLVEAVESWHALEAAQDAPDVTAECRIQVRPLVERTVGEGAARHPEQLHPAATSEAHAGWANAEGASRAAAAHSARHFRAHDLQALADQQRNVFGIFRDAGRA